MVERKLPKLEAWVRFPSPAPEFFTMFSCKFIISYEKLENLNSFLEKMELYNVSIFENADLGFSQDLDENGFPIAKFFEVEVFVNDKNESENLQKTLNKEFPQIIKDLQINEVDNKNWVDSYLKELKPVIIENFYFYNDSIQKPIYDSNLIPIKLNSALAFGSGHHQTTQACIMNAKSLHENSFYPINILDMGCGTGILGICASKLWQDSNVLGIDIDLDAVKITLDNYQANDIKANAIVGSNLNNIDKKFDLIFCNILKQPLLELAKSFYEKLNKGGCIITSGFITSQEKEIIDKYQKIGFIILNKISMEDWLSVLFRR